MRSIITKACRNPDELVIAMDYEDAAGAITSRVVSPIRFVGGDRFLALCLCREEPRQFYLERCNNGRLVSAAEVLMPVAIS